MGLAVQVAEGPTVGGGWRLETRIIVMDLEIVLTLVISLLTTSLVGAEHHSNCLLL